jgi:tRNA pseudouridine38-40 synthase
MCGPEIIIRHASWASNEFHARFSAIWRHYQYTIYNAEFPDPFLVATSWHVVAPLNLRALHMACDPIIGTHDFSAFCRRPKQDLEPDLEGPETNEPEVREVSLKRNVMQATWHNRGDGIFTFDIRANAFCHQMVRSLVGTFVDIGVGKRPSSDMMTLIRSGDRAEASQLAPPQGLCLVEVGYPDAWVTP